ncbi:Bck1p [Rhizophagus irregularis DAOM 197198w]|uniref:Bck1p n=1 Tax=Rhizophagus irregularis (strain DAOM 197198w) TaxID=1432141 RepID=A0A015KIQ3_RHIIW|nr:Bck1p [Rhizophagus irregularis DAOM 197198w]
MVKPSGNKVIDDFIRETQISFVKMEGKLEFVPYEQFKNVEFIAEGGFSKIYKATWIDGPIKSYRNYNSKKEIRLNNYTVVLKKLNNSKSITSKELNEAWIGYNSHISKYFGITQDPITQDTTIIMPYYDSGDLIYYITNNFYNASWYEKLKNLRKIIIGLANMHSVNIMHRDLHSGNILFNEVDAVISDLGISKAAVESSDDGNEIYGNIPYIAPEIFDRQKYTKASDVYSFGMIMWELMTGRRPFWDQNHDIYLIIEICDGLRPPIVTNAPEGYTGLMKECWNPDPKRRPNATSICNKIDKMYMKEWNNRNKNPTKIIKSPDIGPVIINNPSATYKSRSLSGHD